MVCGLIHLLAVELERKRAIAQEHLSKVKARLSLLEVAIVERYGDDWLRARRVEESGFRRDVLDPKKRKTLESPYDLKRPDGKCAPACGHVWC